MIKELYYNNETIYLKIGSFIYEDGKCLIFSFHKRKVNNGKTKVVY